MSEFFEGIMLICFGCSWPMSVFRNIKAKSAKNMSLGFIVLIIVGYIAGISAKVINRNYSFILFVYAFNLFIVSINLIVYFVNCSYDRKKEKNCNKNVKGEMTNV